MCAVPKVVMWWDMESAPPPAGFSSCEPTSSADSSKSEAHHVTACIQLVTQALRLSCGLYGPLAVHAYSEKELIHLSPEMLEVLEERGIALKQAWNSCPSKNPPAGGAATTAKKMATDMFFWALEHPPPTHIVLISCAHDATFMALLLELHVRGYTIVLATKFPAAALAAKLAPASAGDAKSASFMQRRHEPCIFKKVTNCAGIGHVQPHQLLRGRAWNICLVSVDGQIPFSHIMKHETKSFSGNDQSGIGSGRDGSSRLNLDVVDDPDACRVATLEDVRIWLHLFASSESGLQGLELKSVVQTFELEHHGTMRLDVNSLGFKGLSQMLQHFSDVVRITRPRTFVCILYPVAVDPHRSAKLRADFKLLLATMKITKVHHKRVEIPIASLKERFKAAYGYELDHEAAGFQTLHKFILSMPELNVKIQRIDRQSKIMSIAVHHSRRHPMALQCPTMARLITS